ncbi:hypothetical protein F528_0698 [Neisseria meningitidis 992008]|uniref:Uncharacterized protein n=3 Tax=Neisseria TaxID=482 RepID=A0A0H5QDV6_NEIMI|nr:Hypothetical protein NGK_1642 [Neisseria gonorrhoeae NCCP11945]AHW75167.1 hypothetical protein NMA510612_0865 [Neisseria meningitidis]KER40369.1 hypothetical protein F528_0698 [Neisseria meningitidis 992008]CRZ00197.1 hypothetical protein [Neisseria meningitidis serogroup B]
MAVPVYLLLNCKSVIIQREHIVTKYNKGRLKTIFSVFRRPLSKFQ